MLVISRRIGETFVVGDDVEVTILDISGGKVSFGVSAPKTVEITRLDADSKSMGKINHKGYGRQQKQKDK